MHFCSKCDNMYYIQISKEDENKLIYYCRNCGNEDTNLNHNNICVSKMQVSMGKRKYTHIINNFTKHDPTLPRINSIKCPNSDCLSNKDDEKREVIYLRYDDLNMKYVYLCPQCDTIWKTSEENN